MGEEVSTSADESSDAADASRVLGDGGRDPEDDGRNTDGVDWSAVDADREWWKESVVYQIYPRSFFDADGDGVGDLRGVEEKLDYLVALGVDVVWLNPVYDSPNADNGYDIRDYRAIMDEFGTMDDYDRLLEGFHDRDIRLIMDLVVNHTSDEHEWFRRSRESTDGDYRDFYIWREGRGDGPGGKGEPPNNWESAFGGSAWTYDERTEAYYLHLFDEKQPDLNWDNPEVRARVYDMMEWWLDRGIDGFRMDVIDLISKAEGLPDGDPDSGWTGAEHFMTGPRAHEFVAEMYEEVLEGRDVMTVGEMPGATVEEARQYLVPDGDGLDMIFHFEHVSLDHGESGDRWSVGDLDLAEFKQVVAKWQTGLYGEGWNSVYLGNHDWPRMVSRFGDDGLYRIESAKLLATLLFTLRGTPYVYQGDEIGMTNFPFERESQVRDVSARNFVERKREQGWEMDDILEVVSHRGRDNARTPMQWSDGEHAGFTEGEPWMPVNPNYDAVNVAEATAREDSIWHYYRELIEFRQSTPVAVYGDFELLLPDDPDVFAYLRTLADDRLLTVLNLSEGTPTFTLPESVSYDDADCVLHNYAVDAEAPRSFELRPWEARVYELE
ncbi:MULTISPECIES: alpha-glucosidase [Halorussus]|uniref:glycoside hydrolase family 13 protein n=1 Tax=Halorussus TaxID=1070314 RepID=UPI000E211BCE|nr:MULTISPECIES: alpha-glucosidase [Halorussus]NHN58659.1 alpha-glucosidase [Halorussus sp. JP-T4]